MSALEKDALVFLPEMVDRGKKVYLTDERRRVLARWAIKVAMVYEFTSLPNQQKYFAPAGRAAFRGSFAIPENLWIWAGRYDGVRPLHALQLRGRPVGFNDASTVYSFTFGANFLVLQLLAFRQSADYMVQLAKATIPERLTLIEPTGTNDIWWPPPTTIDDQALDVLDTRFAEAMNKFS
jgi:hypothetical protein